LSVPSAQQTFTGTSRLKMFSHSPLPARLARARCFGIAVLAGVCATAAATAPAQASTSTATPPVGDAVIASAGGTAIDTTSGSNITIARTQSRPAASGSLTLNSSDPTNAPSTKTTTAKTTTAARQIGGSSLESPTIVEPMPHRVVTLPRSALTQLQSDGPIIASSGTTTVTRHARRHASRPVLSPAYTPSRSYVHVPRTVVPAGSTTVEINAPGVHFFISQTAVRRPSVDTRSSAPARWFAPATFGLAGFAGLLPNDPRPAPAPGGPANSTLFGSGSGSAGVSLLLGIDGLFAIAALLVGAAWRRRSWDLPVLPRQSALLSLALDRPG
jgi:hypothetical protein